MAVSSSPPVGAARRLPARLRLATANAGELRFVGWLPTRTAAVLAPVWLVLGSLTFFAAPGPTAGLRVLGSLFCLGVGFGLIAGCRPRRVELRLQPGRRSLRLPDGSNQALSSATRWLLSAEYPFDAPRPRYLALLVDGDRRWPLLSAEDPAQLLSDLRRALEHWPAEVGDEWALPSGAQPWSFHGGPTPAPAGSPDQRAVRGLRAGRGLRWVLGIATGLVLLDLTLLLLSASEHVSAVHPLSMALPAITGSWLVVIASAVLTRWPRLVVGSQLVLEQRVLGLRFAAAQIPIDSVRGVYLLAPQRGIVHLLVDGTQGPLALPLSVRNAQARQQELLQSLGRLAAEPQANGSAASAPRRWQSG